MAKEALIKLRCSAALKERLTALANENEQSLSDYIRTKLIEYVPELRDSLRRAHASESDLPPHDQDVPA